MLDRDELIQFVNDQNKEGSCENYLGEETFKRCENSVAQLEKFVIPGTNSLNVEGFAKGLAFFMESDRDWDIYKIQDMSRWLRQGLTQRDLIYAAYEHELSPFTVFEMTHNYYIKDPENFDESNTHISSFMPALFLRQCRNAFVPEVMAGSVNYMLTEDNIHDCQKAFAVDEGIVNSVAFHEAFNKAKFVGTEIDLDDVANHDGAGYIQDIIFQFYFDFEN